MVRPSPGVRNMKVETSDADRVTLVLDRKEIDLLRLALERATFVDTPPGRQDEILRFAEDLLKGIGPRR